MANLTTAEAKNLLDQNIIEFNKKKQEFENFQNLNLLNQLLNLQTEMAIVAHNLNRNNHSFPPVKDLQDTLKKAQECIKHKFPSQLVIKLHTDDSLSLNEVSIERSSLQSGGEIYNIKMNPQADRTKVLAAFNDLAKELNTEVEFIPPNIHAIIVPDNIPIEEVRNKFQKKLSEQGLRVNNTLQPGASSSNPDVTAEANSAPSMM